MSAGTYIRTKEIRKKQSEAMQGHICLEETKRKIGLGNKGKIFTLEHRKKLSISNRGKHPNFGITTRFKKGHIISIKTKEKMSISHKGEKHYNWQGGISKLPYAFEFNKKLKEKIRDRDNYQCQNKECNITEEEHIIIYGNILIIHHIDYDKKNCKEDNLVSLCRQCNSRVNFNKEYWINYFKEMFVH